MINVLIYVLIAYNIVVFCVYGRDKALARKGQQRISEKTLLLVAFCCGTGGALLGMLFFTHKTAKSSFLFKFLAVSIVQIVLCYFLFYK